VAFLSNNTTFSTHFTIKKGGQEVDLVPATEKCNTAQAGVAINITDQTYEVPWGPSRGQQLPGTCAVLGSPSPTLAANPCRLRIDEAAAASISSELHASSCRWINPPADCPKENAIHRLAVAGVMSVAAAFNVIGFLLA
jgi:hypothetical protein